MNEGRSLSTPLVPCAAVVQVIRAIALVEPFIYLGKGGDSLYHVENTQDGTPAL
jgi:hypothetical protein